MTLRDVGLLLVWAGAFALVTVLLHRIRHGAWGSEALDEARPVAGWVRGAAILGLGLALAGIAAILWSFAGGVE